MGSGGGNVVHEGVGGAGGAAIEGSNPRTQVRRHAGHPSHEENQFRWNTWGEDATKSEDVVRIGRGIDQRIRPIYSICSESYAHVFPPNRLSK